MALSRRYHPEWPASESGFVGFDFSPIIPPGVTLSSATLTILTNANPPAAQTVWTQAPVVLLGRQAWCSVSGGEAGVDFQFRWLATDTAGNTWNRTALMLCASTS